MDLGQALVGALGAYFDAARRGDARRMEMIADRLDRDLRRFEVMYQGKTQKEVAGMKEKGAMARTEKEIASAEKRTEMQARSRERAAEIAASAKVGGKLDPLVVQSVMDDTELRNALASTDDYEEKQRILEQTIQRKLNSLEAAAIGQGTTLNRAMWERLLRRQFEPLLQQEEGEETGGIIETGRSIFSPIVEGFKNMFAPGPPALQQPAMGPRAIPGRTGPVHVPTSTPTPTPVAPAPVQPSPAPAPVVPRGRGRVGKARRGAKAAPQTPLQKAITERRVNRLLNENQAELLGYQNPNRSPSKYLVR